MRGNRSTSAALIASAVISTVFVGEARAQSAASNEAEIAALKQQLRLIGQKLDALQKQAAANAKAAAKADAKLEGLDAKVEGKVNVTSAVEGKVNLTSAYADIPVKAPAATPGVVVTMPGNRPTICTADNLNCVSITARLHFDAGGYDYHPNTLATNP